MEPCFFDEILEKVKPLISKQDTIMRSAISPHERLCITMRFLASGASYKDLMYSFRVSAASISKFIPEVCQAIYNVLHEEYLSPPSSREQWQQLASEFEHKWQFPHAVGAIDGKHINIKAPPNSGSEYFNYKKQFSIVLLAIADANAKFIAFDLGAAGSQSDGGVFKNGSLGNICNSHNFPAPCHLGQRMLDVPFFLLGDEAFALDEHLMKPYPHRSAIGDEKVFNYRLSRARRIVENAFGILCTRFRVLLRTLELDVPSAMQVVRACLVLHNFLLTKKDKIYYPPGMIDSEDEHGNLVFGSWRALTNTQDIFDLRGGASRHPSTLYAREIRDNLKEYFYDEGAVEFQWKMVD
jgi:hypothetical protein